MAQNNGPQSWANLSEGANNSPPVLVARNLCKSYGAGEALQNLSFSLHAGRVLGFLGPNGAGKTTTIRILTTMLEPSSGDFSVGGISSRYPRKIRRIIGVLPEGLGFPKSVTSIEYLTYFGRLYGYSASEARRVGHALLQDVGLQNRVDSATGTFSHGMRQRLGIARALINDPKVVFLDEPTLGLDPRGQRELLAMIRRIARERSAGVVLSSHLLSEIEGICDDVVIMNAGQVVAKGTVAEVTGQSHKNSVQRIAVRIRVLPGSMTQAEQILRALPAVKQVAATDTSAGWLVVELADPANGVSAMDHHSKNSILAALIDADIPILGFDIEGGRLQDIFLQLTAEEIT